MQRLTAVLAMILACTSGTGCRTAPDDDAGQLSITIESHFDTGLDGWGLEAINTDEASWTTESRTAEPATYLGTGGNSGGCITREEEAYGITEYFVAPAHFLGNQTEMYGGELAFDLRQERNEQEWRFEAPGVILEGAGITLYVDLTNTILVEWSTQRVALDVTAGWRIQSTNKRSATELELRQVLANLTSIWIRAEYDDGVDNSWLDNVVMKNFR